MTKSRNLSDLLDTNGDVKSGALDNVPASDNASALTTGTLPDARLSNQVKVVKSGSAPGSPQEGDLWYDTTNDVLKAYDSTVSAFAKIFFTTPVLSSVDGSIVNTVAGNLTLNGSGFQAANLVVTFTPSGGSASTVTVTPTSASVATVAVPSAIYGLSVSTVVAIKVTNEDSKSSASINKTVISYPTGGTVTTHGSYRVHTFLTSANFVVSAGFSKSMDTLIVAGGGAGGNWHAGGGGAGGMITYNTTPSANTYSIVVGAGGAGGAASVGSNGANSSAFGQTASGGGRGGNYSTTGPTAGGSGAGGNGWGDNYTGGGAGTSGQGNNGGNGGYNHAGGGGGGKGAIGSNASSDTVAGNGGVGATNDYRTGSAVYYAGGGGGGVWQNATKGTGGNGGGGDGSWNNNSNAPTPGTANTGGGGGGHGGQGNNVDRSSETTGGSGIVVIRYLA